MSVHRRCPRARMREDGSAARDACEAGSVVVRDVAVRFGVRCPSSSIGVAVVVGTPMWAPGFAGPATPTTSSCPVRTSQHPWSAGSGQVRVHDIRHAPAVKLPAALHRGVKYC